MTDFQVTAEDLLAGAAATFAVTIPAQFIIHTANGQTAADPLPPQEVVVQLQPLTIGAFQLIMKAGRQDPGLIPLLLIKEALVQPVLTLEQVKRLPLGLVNFLIAHIRAISGLHEKKSPNQP